MTVTCTCGKDWLLTPRVAATRGKSANVCSCGESLFSSFGTVVYDQVPVDHSVEIPSDILDMKDEQPAEPAQQVSFSHYRKGSGLKSTLSPDLPEVDGGGVPWRNLGRR